MDELNIESMNTARRVQPKRGCRRERENVSSGQVKEEESNFDFAMEISSDDSNYEPPVKKDNIRLKSQKKAHKYSNNNNSVDGFDSETKIIKQKRKTKQASIPSKRFKKEEKDLTNDSNLETKKRRSVDTKITPSELKFDLKPKRIPVKLLKKEKKVFDDTVQINNGEEFANNITWNIFELLAEKENLNIKVAKTLHELFEADNTIPFIARYRKHLTNDMSPEQLRNVKESYEEICSLKSKIFTILKSLEKSNQLTNSLRTVIVSCRSLTELDHIYCPFKPGSKRTLAERAKTLGLEESALALLTGSQDVNPDFLVQPDGPEGLRTVEEVEKGLIHIIAHVFSTDTDVLQFLRKLRPEIKCTMECKQSTTVKVSNDETAYKFENYFNFKMLVQYIKPHQVLAINRGENLKILSVKITIPDFAFYKLKSFCENKWLHKSKINALRCRLFKESLEDAYKRLISPLIVRQTRADLKKVAEKASVEVFISNLKKLLLGTPLKGKVIMGIDPGFKGGCKVAVVSPCGDVLDTGMINPLFKSSNNKQFLKHLLIKHNCTLIALGNGTACRETEQWLTDIIQSKFLQPLDVSYCIVNEQGASIYSCSPEAKQEFPDLDVLLIGAVSLARRVQDPLAEYVKIEPKHLGVGMYQHDLNKKTLETALDEVVSECVSFVGVDLNTASHCLLRRVAGLTQQRADSIIKRRNTIGPFTNRYQLKDIKGIGEKIFQQCAGFLKVGPSNAFEAKEFYEKPETMPLDCTWIHPESYNLAEKIIENCKLHYKQIGQPQFISNFKQAIGSISVNNLVKKFESSETTIRLIIEVLSKPLDYDLRNENPQQPLFRKSVTSLTDIKVGMFLTGRVTNVVHFGAFVDIGVGKNGLIHNNAMKKVSVELGDTVEVKVLNIDIAKHRIGLEAIKKI